MKKGKRGNTYTHFARQVCLIGGVDMANKSDVYKGIGQYCRFCRGDTPNDLSCCTGCPLDTYRRPAPRRGGDGLMKPEFRKAFIGKRVRGFCRHVCLNGHPLSMCASPECPLHGIAFSGRNKAKGERFSGKAPGRRPEALSDTDTTSKRITGRGFSPNITASVSTVVGEGRCRGCENLNE